MNILHYSWNENSAEDVEETFKSLGWQYTKIDYSFSDYEEDPVFESQIKAALEETKAEGIFTFNYFPVLSKVCMETSIPYISWVYDCPHLTLYSKTIKNECNYLFLFDREMKTMVESLGAVHAYHMPLAVNANRLNRQLDLNNQQNTASFLYDVSFVGSLYEKNMYSRIAYLPEYIKGYFEAATAVQQKIWGYNIFEDILDENIIKQALQYIKIEDNPRYSFTPRNILMNMLEQKTTSEERIHLLSKVAECFRLKVFTDANPELLPQGVVMGTVNYLSDMPKTFHDSKININISLRSITSGIPLRCMDIMGAGGFLLSNYQPELAELFVPGEEFVYFESEDDLMEKIEYYLSHEKERMEIAKNGWEKIQKEFSYEKCLKEIFSMSEVVHNSLELEGVDRWPE